MNFVVRNARPEDVTALVRLATGVKLLSIVPDVENLKQRVEKSCDSFAQRIVPSLREYIFVAEELATGNIVGTSALYGSYVSAIHQMHCAHVVHSGAEDCYSRSMISDRFSGIGGFTVDTEYRRHVDKVGTQLGMLRIMLFAMYAEWFTDELVVEIVAQISADGQSSFWNSYGKRFTGLEFAEAYEMARMGERSFMNRFPMVYPVVKDDTCAGLEEACIPKTARGSQHLAKKLGFRFMGSVDPMDGALQYRAQRDDMPIVCTGQWYIAAAVESGASRCVERCDSQMFDAVELSVARKPYLACCYNAHSGFRGGLVGACVDGKRIELDAKTLGCLGVEPGGSIFAAPYDA